MDVEDEVQVPCVQERVHTLEHAIRILADKIKRDYMVERAKDALIAGDESFEFKVICKRKENGFMVALATTSKRTATQGSFTKLELE